jgi:hypothetical protein
MENQTVNLALSDLVMLQSIVQVACERGAFRADEMSQIGQCYDRLSAWLAHMAPSQDAAAPQSPEQS